MQVTAHGRDREYVAGAPETGFRFPTDLPDKVVTYLAHTTGKVPIRQLARSAGCHASTILRQVRRIELQRDDPLMDDALNEAACSLFGNFDGAICTEELAEMVANFALKLSDDDEIVDKEARRILRRLCEKDAFLAIAPDMDRAVVMRESVPGRHTRTAVVERDIAHQFALKEWIACDTAGRIARYKITTTGRACLKRLLEVDRASRAKKMGFADAATPFRAQHQEMSERPVMDQDGAGEKVVRFNLAESPLLILGRKKDRSGVAYLTADLIEAGERLREDFELAQMGPRTTQNWESFLCSGTTGGFSGNSPSEGPAAARERVSKAMSVLGPGLSDVALRVCCFLEGLEAAEKRLGWSARSGKVVLKIALQRLALHYQLRPGQD